MMNGRNLELVYCLCFYIYAVVGVPTHILIAYRTFRPNLRQTEASSNPAELHKTTKGIYVTTKTFTKIDVIDVVTKQISLTPMGHKDSDDDEFSEKAPNSGDYPSSHPYVLAAAQLELNE